MLAQLRKQKELEIEMYLKGSFSSGILYIDQVVQYYSSEGLYGSGVESSLVLCTDDEDKLLEDFKISLIQNVVLQKYPSKYQNAQSVNSITSHKKLTKTKLNLIIDLKIKKHIQNSFNIQQTIKSDIRIFNQFLKKDYIFIPFQQNDIRNVIDKTDLTECLVEEIFNILQELQPLVKEYFEKSVCFSLQYYGLIDRMNDYVYLGKSLRCGIRGQQDCSSTLPNCDETLSQFISVNKLIEEFYQLERDLKNQVTR